MKYKKIEEGHWSFVVGTRLNYLSLIIGLVAINLWLFAGNQYLFAVEIYKYAFGFASILQISALSIKYLFPVYQSDWDWSLVHEELNMADFDKE